MKNYTFNDLGLISRSIILNACCHTQGKFVVSVGADHGPSKSVFDLDLLSRSHCLYYMTVRHVECDVSVRADQELVSQCVTLTYFQGHNVYII